VDTVSGCLLVAGVNQAYSAGVDGKAVVLVLDVGTNDVNSIRIANIEPVSVVSEGGSGTVVNSDALEGQTLGTVDAEDLNGRVLDCDILDV